MIYSSIVKFSGGYNGIRRKYLKSSIKPVKRFYKLLNRLYNYESNAYLPFNNIVKGDINFPHGISGIFISGGAIIGKNCTIYQQVTIGSNTLVDSKNFGSPKLGNNVLIGAGAKIIGNINIGNNVRIGANVVVTKDVSDNCIIFSGNQIIVQKENLINRVYQNSPSGWGYLEKGRFVLEKDISIICKINGK